MEKLNLPLDLLAVAALAAFGLWQWGADGLSAWSIAALCSAAAFAVIVSSALCFVPILADRKSTRLNSSHG